MIGPVRLQAISGITRQQLTNVPAPGQRHAYGARCAGGGRRADQVHLFEQVRGLHRAVEAVAAQSEERAALVAALRRQFADGTYRIDTRTIARGLIAAGRGE